MAKARKSLIPKLSLEDRQNRQILVNVGMYLLNQEGLKNQYWEIKSIKYNSMSQKLNIGINTTDGKFGTTLEALRKQSKGLAEYLYEQGVTFRVSKIKFFIDREDEKIQRIYDVLDRVKEMHT